MAESITTRTDANHIAAEWIGHDATPSDVAHMGAWLWDHRDEYEASEALGDNGEPSESAREAFGALWAAELESWINGLADLVSVEVKSPVGPRVLYPEAVGADQLAAIVRDRAPGYEVDHETQAVRLSTGLYSSPLCYESR